MKAKKKIYKAARGKKCKSATIKLTADSQQKPSNNSANLGFYTHKKTLQE